MALKPEDVLNKDQRNRQAAKLLADQYEQEIDTRLKSSHGNHSSFLAELTLTLPDAGKYDYDQFVLCLNELRSRYVASGWCYEDDFKRNTTHVPSEKFKITLTS